MMKVLSLLFFEDDSCRLVEAALTAIDPIERPANTVRA
jgi:hypothetical protein